MSTSENIGESTARDVPGWNSWARGAVSAVLVFHIGAVLTAPLSVPPTITGDLLRSVYRPYIAATYLNHAYKFFAPDPGPSHLIRYELTLADGSKKEGVFPDARQHWPRLWYHRHFMLSEIIHDGRPPEAFELEPGREEGQRGRLESVLAPSYARHLLAAHDAREVTLYYRMHLLPGPGDVLAGDRLDDPKWYRQRRLVTLKRDGM